ncbi:hypothetical protein M427DRAFT_287824 [Gonapodya prolifera JEL478]|uniref:Uncharacterized protein n=1 Tax=Gonapodya prolifera (strain JEL478) TaxID=1344416 RepID=A0A139AIL0_GONPJ|nr:hypothetical protein M427DRAFT_287824 [Gonapodya prolifera JEL478]|eukprot:KXS16578.1 hypothetical protein M427DRAFT_287824 [Gonapodya prolifera JEL478]
MSQEPIDVLVSTREAAEKRLVAEQQSLRECIDLETEWRDKVQADQKSWDDAKRAFVTIDRQLAFSTSELERASQERTRRKESVDKAIQEVSAHVIKELKAVCFFVQVPVLTVDRAPLIEMISDRKLHLTSSVKHIKLFWLQLRGKFLHWRNVGMYSTVI